MTEYDQLGRDRFLAKYGFGRARRYVVLNRGRQYDSKALLGVAHRYAAGTALVAGEFSGGVAAVGSVLGRLGFDFRDIRASDEPRSGGPFGALPAVPEGSAWSSRDEARAAGVHRARQAGIVGTGVSGAESVVVSGGYEDDEDYGDLIIYTGHGGRDDRGRQIDDQTFDSPGNAALQTSSILGTPVRVIRGTNKDSAYAPVSGYRYDGLFRVERAWHAEGRSGYRVCRFRLVKLEANSLELPDPPADESEMTVPDGNATPGRRAATVQRVVRSTAVANYVKRLHDHTCQTCGTRVSIGTRGYSEGAHIRPLGRPHDGPDISANVLCLCPNCHVLFDNGAMTITGTSVWVNGIAVGELRLHEAHQIDPTHLDHHRLLHHPDEGDAHST